VRYPAVPCGEDASATRNSPARSRSNVAAPPLAKTSKPSAFGWPYATRDTENVPAAPDANVAVNVATSSFSTGSKVSLSSVAAWPMAVPSGSARSWITVASTAPRTAVIGPPTNSARSVRWLPTSASAPEPGPPL